MEILDKKFITEENMVSRKVDDEILLVPIVSNTENMDCVYVLSPVSSYIWELLNGENSVKDIVDKLTQEFEVEYEKAERDVSEFIKELLKIKAIREIKS